AQLAGCQSEATFRLPDVNWNQATVNFEGHNENGEAVFLWSLSSRGLSGTCMADEDGNVAQFTVSQNPYFNTGAPRPATEAQLAACRVAANSALPGLTWSQLSVNPTAYPQNGNSLIRWRGPGGVPTGACLVSSEGFVVQFKID